MIAGTLNIPICASVGSATKRLQRTATPKLEGGGAEVKDLIVPLAAVWDKLKIGGNPQHALIASMLSHQCELQATLDDYSEEAFLPIGDDFGVHGTC